MADTIASLFGPTPEQIEYDRQQAERKRMDDLYATNLAAFKGDLPGFATGYALGTGVGEGLGQAAQGIFGMEPLKDPSLAKSKKSREILREFSTSNLDDPTVLSKMARVFADNDMPEQAMAIQAQARQLKSNQPEQFYTATGAELMASNPAQYKGLNKKATYEVSTKTGKPNEIVAAKDADKDVSELGSADIPPGSTNVRIASDTVLKMLDQEAEGGFFTGDWISGKRGAAVSSNRFLKAGTPRLEYEGAISTLQANLAFDTLQAMRDASPTGGALGQVSEKELQLLKDTVTNLDPNLGAETMRKNIGILNKTYNQVLAKFPPEILRANGFDPNLSGYERRRGPNGELIVKDPNRKSIDVSGKVNSKGGTSATSRYNELNAPPPDNYVERR